MLPFPRSAFEQARARMGAHVRRTPLVTSRLLSEHTGFDVRLKAEMFQRAWLLQAPRAAEQVRLSERRREAPRCYLLLRRQSRPGRRDRGGAVRHQGRRRAWPRTQRHRRSTPTRAYGADVVLHGTIWDEANEKARQLVDERGYTYIHPFDDHQLIVGQGTLGLEIFEDWPESTSRSCRLAAAA